MIVKTVEQKEEWEGFLQRWPKKTFLQSWNWGEFQKSQGKKIWRLGIYEQDVLQGISLVIKNPVIKVGKYEKSFLFCPHGPIILKERAELKKELLTALLEELRVLAKKEKAAFIRFAPLWESTLKQQAIFAALGFRKAPMFIHPELTWQLSLPPSEETLLRQMRKTTRYLIRRGLNWPQLKVNQGMSQKDLENFWQLYQETVVRHHFSPFSKNYLEKEISAFQKDHGIAIFSSWLNDQLLASAIIVFWQGIAFYHHGASSMKHSEVPAAYLLQWKVIQEAKKRKCSVYNFWGIASSTARHHPWGGLTLFKRGFGGEKKAYLATQDLVLSWFYWLNWLVEKKRRIKRGV